MPLVAFFLSGAAGLIFEMVWLHRSGLVFGNSIDAATVVLSSFMGGLALGNALVGVFGSRLRPFRTYASLELIVALTGVVLTLLLPRMSGIAALIPSPEVHPWLGNVVRFVTAFSALVVPATAMGATLPLLSGALARRTGTVGVAVGRLYGWNTAGAVAGVLAAELVLIQWVGIFGTACVAAGLNVLAAALALSAARSEVEPSGEGGEGGDARARDSTGPWLMWAALSGLSFLALEVVWFRFLSMYVLTTTLAMGLLLAVVLAAIAGGGLIASVWLRRPRHVEAALPLVACLTAASALASYVAFAWLTSGTQVAAAPTMIWFAIVLTASPSVASGVLFTLLSEALAKRVGSARRATAWLTLANTLGAAAGPAVGAFILLPWLGIERSIIVLSLVYVALSFTTGSRRLAPLAAVAALVWLASGSMESRYIPRVAAAYAADGAEVIATREGPTDTILLMRQSWFGQTVYDRLVTNGFSMSGTAIPAMRYMRYFVYLPMLLHASPLERILVVCYGVGVTAGAATDVADARRIDIVDVSPDIVAMSDEIYPPDRRPLRDSRVRLHIEDGRSYLQRTAERYDLITGEPPPPRHPGVVNIYTREYFQLLRDRLTEGGLATYWVPVARPNPGTDVNTIIRAFCDVFDDCTLWNATPFDFMLLGSRDGRGPADVERLSKPWTTPGLEARFREVGFEQPQQIGATFLGDARYLRELTRTTPPVTDDFPQRLRPIASRPSLSDPRYATQPDVSAMYQQVIDPVRAREAFLRSEFINDRWPVDLREQTLAAFEPQAALNRVLWEGGRPLSQVQDLATTLTTTTLRTLPLWILGSDDVKQRIGESAADGSGTAEYSRALRALTGRDYVTAERLLGEAERRGLQNATTRGLRAFALCLTRREDEAQMLRPAGPLDAQATTFWDWIAMCGERR